MSIISIRPSPPPAIPSQVSSRQFKMQLEIAGLLGAVEAWVAQQPKLVQIAYAESKTFDRSDPMLQAGFAQLGFAEMQVGQFFTAASKL